MNRQLATVARPGVIVSTLIDGDQAQTVTFRADPTERIGYTTEVSYGPARHATGDHAAALTRETR